MSFDLQERHLVKAISPLLFLLFMAIQVAIPGCGPEAKPQLQVFPVSGKVTVNGKPAERAEVSLRSLVPLEEPARRPILPYAYVQKDGTFQIGSYTSNDGAPKGEYVVTIVWPEIKVEGGEEIAGPDRLKGRYNNPSRPIVKVVVEEGDNQIPPIELMIR